jgi:hypothetical protein
VTDNQYRSLPGDGLVAHPAASVLALLQEEREEVYRKKEWEMKAFRFLVNEWKASLLVVSGEKKSSHFVVNGQKTSSLLAQAREPLSAVEGCQFEEGCCHLAWKQVLLPV